MDELGDVMEILRNPMPKYIEAALTNDGERWQAKGSDVWFCEGATGYIRSDVSWETVDRLQKRVAELHNRTLELTAELNGRYDLAALKRCADNAIDEAQEQKPLFDGDPINWGDLGCTGAEYYINDYDNTGYRVIIEEAAPEACKLGAFVRQHLARNGFVDVNVVTEW